MNTLHEVVFQFSEARPDALALQIRRKKEWQAVTYGELFAQVRDAAAALTTCGVGAGDRVAIFSENQPAWAIFDLAILSLGAVVVPIYPSLPAVQVAYILRNSVAIGALAGDEKLLAKLEEARESAPDVTFVVAAGALDEFLAKGRETPLADWDARRAAVSEDDLASLVYTSGTTGDPKGAKLTHRNFLSNADGARKLLAEVGCPMSPSDRFLSFLPLSHVFERLAGHYLPLTSGCSIAYSAGVRTLVDEMEAIKPTIMVCVPRVWEAMQERVQDGITKADPRTRSLFEKTQAVGRAHLDGKRSPILALQRFLLDRLVGRKARARFGGSVKFWVSGGAALNPETARFFASIGIEILEGYGMTESAPLISVNRPGHVQIGTVGPVVPGGELKIAADGEICYRGPNVMPGYWENDTATAEMIDDDGWLHTGDIGVLESDGYLKITDRKKDIIVLANGKNVAPQPIEAQLKQSPFISEIVLIGDKQSVVTALVIPAKDKLKAWAESEGRTYPTDAELLAAPETKKKLKAEIDSQSKALAEFEKVKKFAIIDGKFSIETGELTPTLKVKRKVVLKKWEAEVAELRGDE